MVDFQKFKDKCAEGIPVTWNEDSVNDRLLSAITARHDEVHESWMEAFEDELYDWVNPNDDWDSREEDIKTICDEVNIKYNELGEDGKLQLRVLFDDYCFYKPNYNYYLKQEICVDIFIDSGDYNLDLGCNEVFPHYNGSTEYDIQDECALVWLSKTQGYTKEDLRRNLYENIENRFFETVYEELQNCSSHMNSLVFLKKMTLEEYLKIKDREPVHISKDTRVGLFDKWNGAGGLLDIKLEKDIYIDPKNIHEVIYDEGFKYNIHDVFGVTDRFWEGE